MHNVQQSFCRLFLNNAVSGKLAAQLFSWQTYAVIFARLVTSVCQAMTSRKEKSLSISRSLWSWWWRGKLRKRLRRTSSKSSGSLTRSWWLPPMPSLIYSSSGWEWICVNFRNQVCLVQVRTNICKKYKPDFRCEQRNVQDWGEL